MVFEVLGLLFWVLLVFWLYDDARGRYPRTSVAPFLWVAFEMFFPVLAIVVWLLVRPPLYGYISGEKGK